MSASLDPLPVGHPYPGSDGEYRLQSETGTERRARAFCDHQVLDRLSERMRGFIAGMEMMFVSTADAAGNCDCSIRAGLPGFVCVADEQTPAYPEYRGNVKNLPRPWNPAKDEAG